ncbi:hypothetical protein [Kiloniella sp.]|uniref:hypothetical protein n=1 Tax=Kiloniella sp. TaxID=1938587 RepID=UPI003B01681A
MNWLVISKRDQGNYSEALKYGTQLIVNVSSLRIREAISGRQEKLHLINNSFDTDKANISVGTKGYYRSTIIRRVNSNVNENLKEGDRINNVNGIDIDGSDEFYLYIHNAWLSGQDSVELDVSSYSKPWDSTKIVINISHFGLRF